jgi:dTDP-4-dehydrorhamnose reductase
VRKTILAESQMKRLLITGASGFLGWNLCQVARDSWKVFGTVLSHRVHIENVDTQKVDLTRFRELNRLIRDVPCDAVIHTAAASNPNYCQTNPEESYRLNVEASVNIASLCADHKITYVFTSTDLVFDGLNPPYNEMDPPNPLNVYGEHKALAEERILESYPAATICRMPLMFGPAGPAATSFVQPMLHAMQSGRTLNLFVDEFRTPVSAKDAVAGLLLALEEVRGIIHLGGVERISRYDFGKLLAQVFGLDNHMLNPCRRNEVDSIASRPADVSLNSSKAFKLGYNPSPLKRELQEMARRL